jgi:hypothetical protein
MKLDCDTIRDDDGRPVAFALIEDANDRMRARKMAKADELYEIAAMARDAETEADMKIVQSRAATIINTI